MSYLMVVAGVNAFTQVQQGKIAKGQAEMQADQLEYQGKLERDEALKTAEIIRRAGRKQVGQTNTAYAGAGVKIGEGSALEVERQISLDVEHDAFQTILQGDRRALGLRTDATLMRIDGRTKQKAAYINAAGTLLSSGYEGLKASGWRTGGPGFSGQQAPAPVETRTPKPNPNFRG